MVRFAEPADAGWILQTLKEEWSGPLVERADEFVDASRLPALIAEFEGQKIGLATLIFAQNHVEVITINAFRQGVGVGTALLARTDEEALRRGLNEVRLFTTNDKLDALGFYQKRGYRIWEIHRDTMTRARKLKPEIPVRAENGILIADEIEMRKTLRP